MNALIDGVRVSWTTDPMGGIVYHMRAPAGSTIAEIVRNASGLPADFSLTGAVCVNGREVPMAMWGKVRPRTRPDRRVFVTLHPGMHGGGDTGKQIFSLLATIALLAVSTAFTGAGALRFLGSAFQAGGIGAKAAGVAVGVGGALLIGALSPPPTLDAAPAAPQQASAQLGAASITGNVLSPNGSLPYVCGTRRIPLPLGANPYIEIVGDDQVAEALFVCAGPAKIENIRSGETAIEDIEDAEVQVITGLPGSGPLTLINRQTASDDPNVDVSRHQVVPDDQSKLENQTLPGKSLPVWHPLAAKKNADEIGITIVFPEGLYSLFNITAAVGIPLRIRIRQRGASTWINLPEIHFEFTNARPAHKFIKLIFAPPLLVIPQAPTTNGAVRAYKVVPAQTISPPRVGWVADSYFSYGDGDDLYDASTFDHHKVKGVSLLQDGVEFHLDPDVFPAGTYEIQCMFGAAFLELTPTTYKLADGNVHDLFGYWRDGGTLKAPYNRVNIRDAVTIARIASIWYQSPVADSTGLAMVAVRVKNRQLEQVSAEVSALVPDWDGSEWVGRSVSSNPAVHYRDRLAQIFPDDLIGDDVILDWRQFCIDKSYEISAVLEGQSLLDALLLIASAGYARPRQSETWDVMIDRDRSSEEPVQIFSPRNIANFGIDTALADLPGGFRVTFADRDDDYKQRTIIVRDPEVTRLDLPLEEFNNDGQVTEEAVTERALFDLAQARRRLSFYHFDVPATGLRCRRGDLIGVNHDCLRSFVGYARIKEVLKSGSTVTGLVLDAAFSMPDGWVDEDDAWVGYSDAWAATRFGVAIRMRNGNIITKEIILGPPGLPTPDGEEVSQVAFVTPFADPGNTSVYGQVFPKLDEGCHVVCGRLAQEYDRMIVVGAVPKGPMEWTLTCVDEAPELHASHAA